MADFANFIDALRGIASNIEGDKFKSYVIKGEKPPYPLREDFIRLRGKPRAPVSGITTPGITGIGSNKQPPQITKQQLNQHLQQLGRQFLNRRIGMLNSLRGGSGGVFKQR